MAIAFESGGRLASNGKPPAEWIVDPIAYRSAMFGAIDALLIGMPDATDEDVAREIEGLKGRLLSRIANRRADR